MRLLFVPWGRGMGHLTRCLSIAAKATQHNEGQVSIVAEDKWATFIDQVEGKRENFPPELITLGPWDKWDDVEHVKQSLSADLQLLAKVEPDIVVHDVRPTIPIACELARIPCVTLAQCDMFPGFLFPGEEQDPFWASRLPAFKEVLDEYGLQPLNSDLRELFFRHPVLIPSIPEFDPLPREAKELQEYTGPLIFRPPSTQNALIIDKKLDIPTIFVYGVIQTQRDLDQLLAAFHNTSFHLFITVLPPNIGLYKQENELPQVTISPYVDVATILPKCTAAIIHGGHGSCMTLLSSGIPAVVLPDLHHREQLYNSKRLEKMGIAQCILGEFRWEKVHNAIKDVIQNPMYHTNAIKWQKHLQQWGGAKTAWELLLKCVSLSSDLKREEN